MKRNTVLLTFLLLAFASLLVFVSCSDESSSSSDAVETKTYKKGEKGPAGGIIVYDATKVDKYYDYYDSDGKRASRRYRYIEAAPTDATVTDSTSGSTTTISEFMIGYYLESDSFTSSSIGEGKINTQDLLITMEKRYQGTTTSSEKVDSKYFAAKAADDYTFTNPDTKETYEDWVLPTSDELQSVMSYRGILGIRSNVDYLSSTYVQDDKPTSSNSHVNLVKTDGTNNVVNATDFSQKYPVRCIRYVE